jgi:chemotaxis protein CheD
MDRIREPEKDGNLLVLIGHYALSNNTKNPINSNPNFSIFGLGSCIALILLDDIKGVSAMSHILLPKQISKKKIVYPHKYADLSVKLLLEDLISHGAVRENVKAIIIGGSKIFDIDNNFMGIDNIKAVKNELNALNIQIIKEDTGGLKGRNVIFDTQNFSVYVTTTGNPDFKRIY